MCIGVPMQVVETGEGWAHCDDMGQHRRINTMLVGDQPVGTWLLVFLDSARDVLTADDAARIRNALHAVHLVMQGETDIDHLFADLPTAESTPPSAVHSQGADPARGD